MYEQLKRVKPSAFLSPKTILFKRWRIVEIGDPYKLSLIKVVDQYADRKWWTGLTFALKGLRKVVQGKIKLEN